MFFAGLLAFVVGSAVMLFLSVVILFGIVGSMTSSEPVTVGEHAILKLDFSEDLIESPSSDPFAGIDFATMTARHQVTLYNALRAIETAKNDPRIQGIYLRPNGGGVATYAILEELREALQDFRQGGKFIIAYNETYGQGGYYLASVADKIYLEPHGGMQWTGVSSTLMFYKGLFDKLDIQAEIFRPTACRYKSAVEPYFLSKMSNANREQMQLLVDSYWNVMAEAVAESRGVEMPSFGGYIGWAVRYLIPTLIVLAVIYILLNSALTDAVEQLPERCRIIFKLAKEDGMSHREIAAALDISPSTVEGQLAIAMRRLKAAAAPFLKKI